MERQINELNIDQSQSLSNYEQAIEIILEKTNELKSYVTAKGFSNVEKEIYFFKHVKPLFLSKLIYFNSIYKIEINKPPGSIEIIKNYLALESSKIEHYFNENRELYKYYRSNSTYLDQKYFVREQHNVTQGLDTFYFETDHRFSTSHDYKVAKIIANDLIEKYIEEQLNNLSKEKKSITQSKLNWTASKTALIELIYALHYRGVFDNGNSDIRLIAGYFENVFNIDLGNFYHTYLELKTRKLNRTKFLDSLKKELLKKMDEQDDG
ncbi:MAG: RteC domain-containing protein [Chitinophagaceae bacterium]|nr:RteC domain-containing protein [Chitinophagaceae bacterium]